MSAAVAGSALIWVALLLGLAAVVTGRRRLLVSAAVAAALATVTLGTALLVGDFSLGYVTETTSVATPWPYRLAALWGGMEGSMLFYTTLTLGISAMVLGTGTETRVAGAVGAALSAITLIFANPFATLDMPAIDGDGLLAILQHPAMIYHPPLLYLGLAVLVIPFAVTLGRADGHTTAWEGRARRWLQASWTLLTVGMAAGANWAYVELGWGGFWAWDPVENTALMPWLAITAYLHVSRVEAATGRLHRTKVASAMVPFALSVVGVYLTRSGVTGSIHSFAEDPVVGRVLLLAALAVAVVAGVTAVRAPGGRSWGRFRLDRHGWMGVSALLVSIGLVFVTVGTVYPAALSVFAGETVIVAPRFFATTMFPVAVLVAASLAFALGAGWREWVLTASLSCGLALLVEPRLASLLAGVAAGSLIALVTRMARRRPEGRALVAHLAHAGMALLLLAVAGSAFGSQVSRTMRPGDSVVVAGHEVVLEEVITGDADRFTYARAVLSVDGRPMAPEIRAYEEQATPVAEPRLRSTPLDDVVVMISLLFPDAETVEVSVLVRPLVWWVWIGAAAIALAGLLSLLSRPGAGEGRRRRARAELQPAGTTSGSVAR